MAMMAFSEPSHIIKLLDGSKTQTTRKPRKNPIKAGDTLHCYYIPRMKKGTCINCIKPRTAECTYHEMNQDNTCLRWDNCFGPATVTSVDALVFADMWEHEFNAWAEADGFDDFNEADEWFTAHYGNDWQCTEWQVIHFQPHWIKDVV